MCVYEIFETGHSQEMNLLGPYWRDALKLMVQDISCGSLKLLKYSVMRYLANPHARQSLLSDNLMERQVEAEPIDQMAYVEQLESATAGLMVQLQTALDYDTCAQEL